MNIYWNEEYCAPKTDFETFQKSRYIAKVLPVKDPSDVSGALALAQNQITKYTDPEYLQAVVTGRPRGLAETNGFGWDDGVYRSVLNSTAGILCAVNDTIEDGHPSAGSLSSGLHHANAKRGTGFCTINSLAIAALYAESKGKSVAILDLDAHCGGGTSDMIQGTSIAQFDLSTSQFDNYPDEIMNPYSWRYVMPRGDDYMKHVNIALDKLTTFGPEIVFYNAGVDIYPEIDADTVSTRDIQVAKRLFSLGTKVVIVTAGGYGDYAEIARLHGKTFGAFEVLLRVLA